MYEEKKKITLEKYEKPNRVRLTDMSEYDLLTRINDRMNKTGGTNCILACIMGYSKLCLFEKTDDRVSLKCNECIQRWLNDHDWK